MSAAGLSCESLNASLYAVVYLRALFLLLGRAGGAIDEGRAIKDREEEFCSKLRLLLSSVSYKTVAYS
jgi:hypothetical protein